MPLIAEVNTFIHLSDFIDGQGEASISNHAFTIKFRK